MAVTAKVLVPPKQLENTQTAQYTAVNCKTIIDKATVTNTNTVNVTLSVNLIVSGVLPATRTWWLRLARLCPVRLTCVLNWLVKYLRPVGSFRHWQGRLPR
jgi:hypothetical protein